MRKRLVSMLLIFSIVLTILPSLAKASSPIETTTICNHENTHYVVDLDKFDGANTLIEVCDDCDTTWDKVLHGCVDHDGDQICEECGGAVTCPGVLEHTTFVKGYEAIGNGQHGIWDICTTCVELVIYDLGYYCTDENEDLICDECLGVIPCEHLQTKSQTTYQYNQDGTHTVTMSTICLLPACGEVLDITQYTDACADYDRDGACDRCGATDFCEHIDADHDQACDLCGDYVPCYHTDEIFDYMPLGDGTHELGLLCPDCGEFTSFFEIYDCTDENNDNQCDKCGEINSFEKVTVAGSNMNLGNELQVNFIVDNLPEGGNYTAYIYQDTEDDADYTHIVPMTEWDAFGTTRTRISVRVRAMEMTDTLTLQIMDAEGNLWSDEYTTSVRDYAAKALASASSTDEMKTLVVDMLNYGAAAQENFGYKTDDLANSLLVKEEQALATGDVECSNNQIKGNNNLGSNLALDDCILLNMFFQGLSGKDMSTITAKVTFTNWKDEAKEVVIPGTEFEPYGSTGDRYKVKIDDIVLADAKCLVTVELYEYGVEAPIAYGADSVESYANRGSSTAAAPLYNAIMKFATSAKAYLLSRQ